MKKILILFITIVCIYIIYNIYCKKINYVSITDSSNGFNTYISNYFIDKNNNFNNYFTNTSIINIINDIKNNRTIRINNKDYYLKKVLRESDILVISIGMDELSNNYNKYDMNSNYSYFNKMYNNIIKLIDEIKKYTFGKIIFLGYYNPSKYYDSNVDRFFYDVNIKLERLMVNNEIIYLDLYNLYKGNKKDVIDEKIANSILLYTR